MTLEERILNDYKEAMKAKDAVRSSALSFLRAQMMNAAIEKRKKNLEDAEAIAVIKKQIKQRQDSIEQFTKGNRMDLVGKEAAELDLLRSYLPPELGEDEIKKIIEDAVTALGASTIKDMGKVMKEVQAKVAGQADGKLVSELVKQRLSA